MQVPCALKPTDKCEGIMTKDKAGNSKSKIMLVDDHPIVRQGLSELISHQEDMTVSGEAESVAAALAIMEKTLPDLAIVDISLKDSSGIELIKDMKVRFPDVKVLVLSMHDEAFYAERVLRAGAKGYVTKGEPAETVLAAIRKIIGGEIHLSEQMSSRMLSKFVDGPAKTGGLPAERLTDRELQVFEMIGHGTSTRQIAENLHLSIKTIESHRENIKSKLKLQNATELLRHAIQWVQLEHGS